MLSDDAIRKEFLKGTPKNDSKVVKAFVAANASNALKTRPKVSYSCLLSSLLSRLTLYFAPCIHALSIRYVRIEGLNREDG